MKNFSNFCESRSVAEQIKYKIKYYLLRRLLRDTPHFFMNPSDIITRFTIAYGKHERMVYEIIKFISGTDHNDFMIDIGANIGLTSGQTSGRFQKYYLIEPNPIIFNILKTNIAIHLREGTYEMLNIGLSDTDEESELMIPKDNWGGAFVLDGNSYDQNTLLSKDGKTTLSNKNYLKQSIILRDSESVIDELINKIKKSDLRKGFIKIDVEGFEMKILRKIIPRLRAEKVSCYILFEQWDKSWHRGKLDVLGEEPFEMWRLDEKDPDIKSLSGVIYMLKMFFRRKRIENRLVPVDEACATGNILLKI